MICEMPTVTKTNKELDRLAWKQRIEDADRARRQMRRKQWVLKHGGDAVLIGLTAVIILSLIAILVGV